MFATQASRIEKDMKLLEQAKGAEESARILQRGDPTTQYSALKNVTGDAIGTLGEKIFTNTGAINSLTNTISGFNERLAIGPGSGTASAVINAKNAAAAARRDLAATSWNHPLDKLAAKSALADAIQKEFDEKQKFHLTRPESLPGTHPAAMRLLGVPRVISPLDHVAAMQPVAPHMVVVERIHHDKLGKGFNLGGAPPPSATGFTPGNLNFKELRGAATIKNSLAITLDPGLIAKEVRSQLDASGNLRGAGADTGKSTMPGNK
jgi:hypothetical protein